MSFPRYPEYKDSGVEWLGEVPTSWKLRPFWTLFRRTKRTGHIDEPLLSVYRDHGVVPKASRDDNNNKPSDDLTPYQLVAPGDLAINKMKAWQGSVAISEHRGIVSPAYFVYEATHSENPRYLHYLFRSLRYITGYLSLSKGIRVNQWDLEPQEHSRMPVVLPNSVEQTAIATFLDRETAKIDALVAEQEKLIALLQEKRQAVISHAVTKGLDPNVPMKDSGVEWLGEVPIHWEVSPFKWLLDRNDGGVWGDDPDGTDDTLVLRSTEQTVDGQWRLENAATRKLSATERAAALLESGDLVVTKSSGSSLHIGKTTLVTDEIAQLGCCYSNFMQRLRMKPSFSPLLAWYILNNDIARLQFDLLSNSTTGLANLNGTMIGQMMLAIPPGEEQTAIATFLDRETSKLDTLMTEARTAITLLQERRTALISAAVTGQIDVRGLAGGANAPDSIAASAYTASA